VILPLLEPFIVLVNAFRHGTRRWHLEAPRGMFDGDEPTSELRREHKEEIGATPVEIVDLGAFHPSAGVVDKCLYLYLVRIDRIDEVDPHEAIAEVQTFSAAEFEQLAADGEGTDGPTLGVYLRAKCGASYNNHVMQPRS
jgi:ADP-ribose pyrophosphatase